MGEAVCSSELPVLRFYGTIMVVEPRLCTCNPCVVLDPLTTARYARKECRTSSVNVRLQKLLEYRVEIMFGNDDDLTDLLGIY